MNMQLWRPFQEFEKLFDRYSHPGMLDASKGLSTEIGMPDWAPSVDISEEDEKYQIKADLPGVEKKDITVSLHDGVIRISGEKKTETESGKDSKNHRKERFFGSFSRSFVLPETVDEDKVEANYKDGVLILDIPKTQKSPTKPVGIPIK